MQSFLDNINQDQQITTIAEDLEEVIEIDESDGLFSAAAEVEYLVLGLEKLTWLAFNFMPASIEIKEPRELTFKEKDFTNWINDLLAKLHEVNTTHTGLKTEHGALIKNLNAAIRNNILMAMDLVGNEPEAIAGRVGMQADIVEKYMHAMAKEKQLLFKDGAFSKKK